MPEGRILERCIQRGWKMAVAESCTGGLIGARLTSVPGSSSYFLGGVIAYSNNLKKDLLKVPAVLLDSEGAVSGPVAEAMVRGVIAATGAHCGISVTGVAGPDGGTLEKPVGTVWVGIALPSETMSRQYNFTGNRDEVREQAVNAALELFLEKAGS
ncbi:MAG: CinA family protein [bacterium]|nr:CinA family protein [bacterium]MDT8365076.1 CinA family protein [bacterium]